MSLPLRARDWGAVFILAAVTALVLFAMGRPWWCESGDSAPWSSDVWSRHNSQHLADPYTITHVLHGLAAYGWLWLLFRKIAGPIARAGIGVGIEALWEIVENTNAMIERYRTATVSLGYYGDSIANSLGDIAAFIVGYLAATAIPTWLAVVGFFAVDGLLVLWIRDSLLLNVVMLVYPLEWVKAWQLGATR